MMLKKIGVFISEEGADVQCIIDACADYKIRATVDYVVSSTDTALGLNSASYAGIPTYYWDPEHYNNKDEFYGAVSQSFHEKGIDVLVLIEYADLIPQWFINQFLGRIICSHPSLLPDYIGQEMAGYKSAVKAVENGEKESGCTVFRVDTYGKSFDHILAIEKVPIFETDSPSQVYGRVKKVEHYCLPRVVRAFVQNAEE